MAFLSAFLESIPFQFPLTAFRSKHCVGIPLPPPAGGFPYLVYGPLCECMIPRLWRWWKGILPAWHLPFFAGISFSNFASQSLANSTASVPRSCVTGGGRAGGKSALLPWMTQRRVFWGFAGKLIRSACSFTPAWIQTTNSLSFLFTDWLCFYLIRPSWNSWFDIMEQHYTVNEVQQHL